MYVHDNYVLRIQQYCMTSLLYIYSSYLYIDCVSVRIKKKKERIINHNIDALNDCGLL